MDKLTEKEPKRLKWSEEQNKKFPFEKALFVNFKNDYTIFITQFDTLISKKFEDKPNNSEHDTHTDTIKDNKQSIIYISHDILANSVNEIPLLLMLGRKKEAQHIWELIHEIYILLEKITDKKWVINAFRKMKGEKHWWWGHKVYNLKPWENRLSLLKSALEALEGKELQ